MVAQLVRALACHARGRGFEPHPSRHSDASVAQLVEQGTENPRVVGSIPNGGTISADLAHLVERHLAKVEVAGSSPVIRSKIKRTLLAGVLFVFGGIGAYTRHEPLCGSRVLSRLLLCRIASPLYTRLALLATLDIASQKTIIKRFVARSPRNPLQRNSTQNRVLFLFLWRG